MRIVQEGNSPEEMKHLCYKCNTVFSYDYRDYSGIHLVEKNKVSVLSCPFCLTSLVVRVIPDEWGY